MESCFHVHPSCFCAGVLVFFFNVGAIYTIDPSVFFMGCVLQCVGCGVIQKPLHPSTPPPVCQKLFSLVNKTLIVHKMSQCAGVAIFSRTCQTILSPSYGDLHHDCGKKKKSFWPFANSQGGAACSCPAGCDPWRLQQTSALSDIFLSP